MLMDGPILMCCLQPPFACCCAALSSALCCPLPIATFSAPSPLLGLPDAVSLHRRSEQRSEQQMLQRLPDAVLLALAHDFLCDREAVRYARAVIPSMRCTAIC
jgi:hypothetical protein